MKTNILKIIKILFIPIFILILSSLLSSTSSKFTNSYISTAQTTYTVYPYKNIPLKTILSKKNITLNEDDIISHNIDNPIKPLQTVKITRISKKIKETNDILPFRVTWSRKYNSNLRKVELQKGVEKKLVKTIEEVFHNDVLQKTHILSETVIAKEYYRLLLFDTSKSIEKVYDLSKAKRIKMVATAYYPGDPLAWGDGTITFLGQKMERGIVAVDPKVIPLKTRLFISGYGYGYAGDTGNAIKGNRIDLGVNNAMEEMSWMFRNVTVYILEKSDNY